MKQNFNILVMIRAFVAHENNEVEHCHIFVEYISPMFI